MTLDKNKFPYYDDFTGEKKYYQLMFNPSVAVQARELSQIQSILQDQVSRFGSHIFKEGSMVIPGESSVDIEYPFAKLENTFAASTINLANFINKRIVGLTSGTIATVLQTVETDGVDPKTIYLKYETGASTRTATASISSGGTTVSSVAIDTSNITVGSKVTGTGIPANTYVVQILTANSLVISNSATATNVSASLTFATANAFIAGETITTVVLPNQPIFSASLVASNATGLGSKAQIKRGVYFVNGYFCLVDDQTILLDKYGNTPSYKIGLSVNDSFVTSDDDTSLFDPAIGSPNFNAPGADRYKIELILSKVPLGDEVTENFVETIRVDNGVLQKLVTRPEYSELEKTMARRTYDESGNYTVKYFPLEIKEHLNDGTNNGVYPTPTGDDDKLVLALGAGKAYVKGYEIQTQSTVNLVVNKPRETRTVNNFTTFANFGSYANTTAMVGDFNISTYETVNLRTAITHGGSTIGTAKIRDIVYVTGTPGTSATYQMYLFDIVMSGSNTFSDVRSIGTSSSKYANVILDSGSAILYGSTRQASILSVPEYATKSISDETYSFRKRFSGTQVGNVLTLTSNTNELFTSGNVINYHVVNASTGAVIDMTAGGNSIVLAGSPVGRQVQITVGSLSNTVLSVIATVTKSNVSLKTKTLTTRTQSIAHGSTIQLDRADIYRIVSIIEQTTLTDRTKEFRLDNGQRDMYYDRGRLIHTPIFSAAANLLDITYEYFAHGSGDYFTVDSYESVIPYKDILIYTSPTTGETFDLVNSIDFRPRINDAGNGFSVFSNFPQVGSEFIFDYEAYLPRIDKVYIDATGKLFTIEGSSGVSPQPPKDPENAMALYEINLMPYVFNTADVLKTYIDNRNYTMRDIGKLEKRIDNLEYYTALSLLEKDTSDLFIDDGTGANSFKNGFIVDNFKSHKVGNATNIDYRCAIDAANGLMRPQFSSKSVKLAFDASGSSDFQKTGDLITLPYTEVSFINQPFASLTENLNPYDIFAWIGSIECTPPSDDWYENSRLPDVVITSDDGKANLLAAQNGQVIWGDWEQNWVGQEISRTATDVMKYTKSSRHLLDNRNDITRLPSSVDYANRKKTPDGWWISDAIYTDIVAKEVGQSRTGIQTTVIPTVTNEVISDRVIDTSVIPYMRSVAIDFTAKNLKPNTRIYPFFDNVDVSAYTSPVGGAVGDPIITNVNGMASGTFTVPATGDLLFTTGAKLFRLTDNAVNNSTLATTVADYTFSAVGILEQSQATILSTRSAEILTTQITQDRVIVGEFTETTQVRLEWWDPLAQTFLVDLDGGAFVSKIDIYFATKDTKGIPVTLQIRNVVNGYPGQFILPFSTVSLNPEDVNISDDGTASTSFVFPSPVYLQQGTEYCFVLLANSNEYNIHCSYIGQFDVTTGERIAAQPYAGVMFKSQNASTWTAAQEEDIKFEIFRCSFDTSANASVILQNVANPVHYLQTFPFATTSGTKNVVVFHENHTFKDGDSTTIAGVTGTSNGIPASELNDTHVVTVVDFDHYSITVPTTNATATGQVGSGTITATENIRVDTANLNVQSIFLPNTELYFGVKSTNFVTDTLASTFSGIEAGINSDFVDSQVVQSSDNNAASSLLIEGVMTTQRENISPVIDTQRMSLIAIGNRINNSITGEDGVSGGEAIARYITKKVSLSTPANRVRVYFNAARPANSNITVYLKYLADDNVSEAFDDQEYEIIPAIQYPSANALGLNEYIFEIDELVDFSLFAIKVVLSAPDTADVPQISAFRAIALGT